MTYVSARRASAAIGAITAVAGAALVGAPGKAGPLIGLTSRGQAQLVGALDLALAPGLIFGRRRWAWLAARAASNIATAAFLLSRDHGEKPRANAVAFSAILAVATVGDGRAVLALRRGGPGKSTAAVIRPR
jgi:hypothetical protein